MSLYTVVNFYRFKKLLDIVNLQNALKQHCQTENIFGTILLATEGINGTIAGKPNNIQAILSFLQAENILLGSECQYSYSNFIPFHKTKILIKSEIVALKVTGIDPAKKTGIQIAPQDWNDLILNPKLTLIDTRNTYEVALGTFKKAINPHTRKFRDFPEYVQQNLDPAQHKEIAMFCTGGIRCEKASAYLLAQGFENVYQLKGGILNYLDKIPSEERLWEGKCFIFDDRITL